MTDLLSKHRIASLLASGTEMLYGLGLGERVVGVSHECDFPADVVHKPRLTSTRVAANATSLAIDQQVQEMMAGGAALYEIDVDRLVAVEPDLIVTQAQCDVCAVRYQDVVDAVASRAALHRAEIVSLNPQTLEQIFADTRRVGQAAGVPDAAERYIAGLEARVEHVQTATAKLPAAARPRVACIEWIEPVMVSANWMPELVEIAGGRHDLTTNGVHSTYTAWEDIVAFDPEVVVIMPCGLDLARTLDEAPRLRSLPGWSGLAACRTGRVFACDGNAYFNRSGPRIVDSLELLAALVQPERFKTPFSASEMAKVCARFE